jgi:hypothetical protein
MIFIDLTRCHSRQPTFFDEFILDPMVGGFDAFFKANQRLPAQRSVDLCVVAVSAPYTLRPVHVVPFYQFLVRYRGYKVDQSINRD